MFIGIIYENSQLKDQEQIINTCNSSVSGRAVTCSKAVHVKGKIISQAHCGMLSETFNTAKIYKSMSNGTDRQ